LCFANRLLEVADNSDSKCRLADLDRKIGNLVRAIEDGEYNGKVKTRLAELEAEKKELPANLKPDKLDRVEELLPKLEERYPALVNNLGKALPPAELSRSRRIVAGLLGDVILRPTTDGGLNAEMNGQYPGYSAFLIMTISGSRSAKAADRISSS
jgi:hypothetical protein